MEKITVQACDVRGLGNILSSKTLEDYTPYHSSITEESDFIDNVSVTVYSVVAMLEGVRVSVSASFVRSGDAVTVSVLLTDENGDPLSGESVELFKVISDE